MKMFFVRKPYYVPQRWRKVVASSMCSAENRFSEAMALRWPGGHGNPPHIAIGTVVRIVKCIPQIIFYDLMINGTEYHRWLAEFELAAQLPK